MCKGQLATVVLLLGCWLLYKKRAGLVLLHCGIGLMMFGEVLTGLTAVEGHMQMVEGETASYVRHIRSFELAVIDHSDPDRDGVVVVPESLLLSGTRIGTRISRSTFDSFTISRTRWSGRSARRANPATAGIGLSWLAEPSPAGLGDRRRQDQHAGRLRDSPQQGHLGLPWHLSRRPGDVGRGSAEEVEVNGKTYEVSLRQRRTYKPYSMKLIDVQKEDYPGTDIPRHYASLVHLVDQSRHVDRTVKIWMNNPLRFAGETFYQSGYYKDPKPVWRPRHWRLSAIRAG